MDWTSFWVGVFSMMAFIFAVSMLLVVILTLNDDELIVDDDE